MSVSAFAAFDSVKPLGPFSIRRREPGPRDVAIDILYCGVCHSDIHMARNEWGGTIFPIVPGHEIVGKVTYAGNEADGFKIGDLVGVGCLVNSCRTCEPCRHHLEQYCEGRAVMTYNSYEADGSGPTYGGYSTAVVVDKDFVLKIPATLDPAASAPLLCAGITTYSPLKKWNAGPGKKVAVVGLGGLGHMAVKIACAMGAEVHVISTTPNKAENASGLGAGGFILSTDAAQMKNSRSAFDLIINTVSAPHDINALINLLKTDGTMVMLGVPPEQLSLIPYSLISRRRSLAGSLIGGIKETQEMLDFCGIHGITADGEIIRMDQINEAYERMIKGLVKYRFVIDNQTLK